MKEQSLSSELLLSNYALTSLKAEFLLALADTPEGGYLPKPKSLDKAKKLKRQSISKFRDLKDKVMNELDRRTGDFLNAGPVTRLQSRDLAYKSMILEANMESNGVTYGDNSLNFCLEPLKISSSTLKSIESAALSGYQTAINITPDIKSKNELESYLDNLALKPNGARVDIILTDKGPKIIEINFQWVDGIQFLQGLRNIVLGPGTKPSPIALLSGCFATTDRLGILFVNPATGSRQKGEQYSLEKLSSSLVQKNVFSQVEILDSDKTRSEYISNFSSIYLDGDPKMLARSMPDWIKPVFGKVARKGCKIFPTWFPAMDRKTFLVKLYQLRPDIFASTKYFTDNAIGDTVLKGDGFSSRQVALPGSETFNNMLMDARLFPDEYILQEQLSSFESFDCWAYDTSAGKPVYLRQPNTKFNVWIINDQMAGVMVSMSENKIISDKDFNTVPLAV